MANAKSQVAVREIVAHLTRLGTRFALVGGLAVGARAEARFTADVDVAVSVADDAELEALVFQLRGVGYEAVTTLEQDRAGRLATVRLASPQGITVDLLAASCGIEPEVVARAEVLKLTGFGQVPVARAEELLAMKVLSMSDRRARDKLDGVSLILMNETLDLDAVRANLALIVTRGFHRGQDLAAKLESVLAAALDA